MEVLLYLLCLIFPNYLNVSPTPAVVSLPSFYLIFQHSGIVYNPYMQYLCHTNEHHSMDKSYYNNTALL